MNKDEEYIDTTLDNNKVNVESVEKFDVDTFNPYEDADGQYNFIGG